SYIVYLGSHSHGPNPSISDLKSATNCHYDLLSSHLGSHEKAKEAIFYSYNKHINGFAALLEEEKAAEIAKNPIVVSVFENKGYKLMTTRSWEFLGLENSNGIVSKDSIWEKAKYGEASIIANIDTGVWPESMSFNDEGMGPVPTKWRGICQLDNFRCNRKLIGARFFSNGYESKYGKLSSSLYTARDTLGHGTQTLSITGGNFVRSANVFGLGNGTAKGGSPKAHVAAYKVCWATIQLDCTDADVLEAFEASISDGVDVINFSLGKPNPTEFFEDGFSIGAFHAVSKGIIVIAAGGNSGPKLGTVTNVAPWMFTVGASTIDRDFANYVALGDKRNLMGTSLTTGLPSKKFYSLINSVDAKVANAPIEDAEICKIGSLDPKKTKGKILVCLLNEIDGLVYAEEEALSKGTIGLILANNKQRGNDIIAYAHLLPTTHINYTDGEYVYSYIRATKNPKAYMSRAKTEVGVKPAPLIASLSSRGPNLIQPSILKPDVIAPGVDIVCSTIESISPTGFETDSRRIPYTIESGTSISSPHVAAIAALLKILYPDWTPAAIRSAIMTTATTMDENDMPLMDQSKQEAIPFAYGAGHIEPELATDPGLVYDLNIDDYLNFLCAHHGYNQTQISKFYKRSPHHVSPEHYNILDFNYPSIVVPNLGKHLVEVSRTVTNVGSPGIYWVYVKEPYGVSVLVKPKYLEFNKVGEKKTFKVSLKALEEEEDVKVKPTTSYVFGELWLFDGKHKVKSPRVVKHNK
ncbi:hypothetical protein PIB30_047836, partial [Stylosanthes scabra]|nr:hypothetical protein [Stylosanthes scabra]